MITNMIITNVQYSLRLITSITITSWSSSSKYCTIFTQLHPHKSKSNLEQHGNHVDKELSALIGCGLRALIGCEVTCLLYLSPYAGIQSSSFFFSLWWHVTVCVFLSFLDMLRVRFCRSLNWMLDVVVSDFISVVRRLTTFFCFVCIVNLCFFFVLELNFVFSTSIFFYIV